MITKETISLKTPVGSLQFYEIIGKIYYYANLGRPKKRSIELIDVEITLEYDKENKQVNKDSIANILRKISHQVRSLVIIVPEDLSFASVDLNTKKQPLLPSIDLNELEGPERGLELCALSREEKEEIF